MQKAVFKFPLRSLKWSLAVPLPPYESRFKLIYRPGLDSKRTWLSFSYVAKAVYNECHFPILLSDRDIHIPVKATRNLFIYLFI